MKLICLGVFMFFLLLGNIQEALSNPVDIQTARVVAQNFMNGKQKKSSIILDVVIEKQDGQNSIYVVNFQGGGWVMVSADNSAVPIIAYSLEGTYKIDDPKPDAFLDLILDYKEQIISSSSKKKLQIVKY